MKKYIDVKEVVRRLEKRRAGRSYRAFAAEVGVTAGYIYDVLHFNRAPGPQILEYLRVPREVNKTVRYLAPKEER